MLQNKAGKWYTSLGSETVRSAEESPQLRMADYLHIGLQSLTNSLGFGNSESNPDKLA